MKRRLLCLALCIVALCMMAFLTSCGGKEEETSREAPRTATAVTITFNSIKGPGTTKEAIEAIQKEINKITETKLNVHVVLQFFEEKEYFDKILDMLEKGPIEKEEPNEPVETDEFGNQIGYDEQGRVVTIYPDVMDNQVDIFLIRGYDDYKFLRDFGYLEELTQYMKESTDGVDKHLIKNILNEINLFDNSTYFIPTNDIIGEYEYLLINKELYDKYDHSLRNLQKFDNEGTIMNIKPYLLDILANEPNVIPLLNVSDLSSAGYKNLRYYGSRFDKVKVTDLKAEAKFNMDSLLSDLLYTNNLELFMHLKASRNYTPSTQITDTVDTSVAFGAAYIRGDKNIAEQYKDDYYVVMTRAPLLTNDQLYDFGYAISMHSAYYADRCMDVLNLMYKDKNIANLLAYGVQRVHYNINDNGVVFNRTEDYSFNFNYVPNKFLVYQNTDMTEKELKYSADGWALAKVQNGESGLHPHINFILPKYDFEDVYNLDKSLMDNYKLMLKQRQTEQETLNKIKALDDDIAAQISAFVYNTTMGNGDPAYKYTNSVGNEVTRTLKQYLAALKETAASTAGPYKDFTEVKSAYGEFWDSNRASAS